jgi:hypothetical protein
MSKRCVKCENEAKMPDKGKNHNPTVCSRKNYEGSSKGMEAHGALLTCLKLHQNHNMVYKFVVMDDDSLSDGIQMRH